MAKKELENEELPGKEGAPPGGGVKTRRLVTLVDLRRLLADTLNRLNRDEISESKARVLGYLASVMSGVIRDGDIEKRLEALEQLMEEKQ